MINMLSNKQVYEKQEVDNEIATVNQTIDNTKDTLEAEIKEAVSTAFEYKGPCRYMGSYPVNTFPPANLCRKNDIIRWDNNTVIQIIETGTNIYRVLTDIHAGWVFNLTESCTTDSAWVDEYGATIAENTSIAVVKLPSLVYGCIWGFDAFADAASSGFHVDDEMSHTSVNPVQNKVITEALDTKMDNVNPTGTGSFSLNRYSVVGIGDYSFSEGYNTSAKGDYSHSEGHDTFAIGSSSHVEGALTTAHGTESHAEGLGTTAIGDYQHVQGKYNVDDTDAVFADIIGNGEHSNYRKNIEATTWTGDKRLKGDVYLECNDDSTGGTSVKGALASKADTSSLATVATSGSYNDLSNKPALDFIPTSEKGASNGVATLDATGRVPYTQLPESAMEFEGGWDASNNIPELKDGTGTNGDFYVCNGAGTVNFGTTESPRNVAFYVNDRALYDGTNNQWIRLPASEVRSVNGMSGDVNITKANIGLGNVDNTSDADKPVSTAQATAISNAINALDVASVGGSGKYLSAISEIDGKISATAGDIDSAVTGGSSNPVTSGAVANAISNVTPIDSIKHNDFHPITSNAIYWQKFYCDKTASLSTEGWYKIATFGKRNNGAVVRLELRSSSFYEDSCSHHIELVYGWQSLNLKDFANDSSGVFSKLKLCYNDNNNDVMALYVYYSPNKINNVEFSIELTSATDREVTLFNFTTDSDSYDNEIIYNLGTKGTMLNADDSSLVDISNLVTMQSGVSSVYAYRKGNICYVYIFGTYTGSPTNITKTIISGLPQKYIPKIEQTFCGTGYITTSPYVYPCRVRIKTNGNIEFAETAFPTNTSITIGFTYIID